METLATFYKSKKWESLLRVIKMERLTEAGELICEYCGKPIFKRYDCIGHHKTQLTEENVNNAEISLNPENIQLVHHRCHNRIHEKLGAVRKEVFIVYGPPLAGKSRYIQEAAEPGDLIIDMDSIWECISGLPLYVKPARLNSVAFGVRDFLIDCVRVRRGKWNHAYICGGFPLISERERLQKDLGARLIFIDTDKETCLQRAAELEDQDARAAWREYIETWWRRYMPDPAAVSEE